MSTDPSGCTARAVYEARCHAAIARYRASLDEYTRRTVYATLIDDLLRAGDKYALNAAELRQLNTVLASGLNDALSKVMQHA